MDLKDITPTELVNWFATLPREKQEQFAAIAACALLNSYDQAKPDFNPMFGAGVLMTQDTIEALKANGIQPVQDATGQDSIPQMHFYTFPRDNAGASCVVLYQDKRTEQIYVLMGYNQENTQFQIPQGFKKAQTAFRDPALNTVADVTLRCTAMRELCEETGYKVTSSEQLHPFENKPHIKNPDGNPMGHDHQGFLVIHKGPMEKLPRPTSNEFSFADWINIADFSGGETSIVRGHMMKLKGTVPEAHIKTILEAAVPKFVELTRQATPELPYSHLGL